MASQIKPRLTSISSLILFIIFGVLLSLLMYETFLSKNFEPLDLAISNWAVANNYDSILRSFLTIITKATASSVMAVLTIIATITIDKPNAVMDPPVMNQNVGFSRRRQLALIE